MKRIAIAAIAGFALLSGQPAIQAQSQGPCALLTTAEVQRVFPGSKDGRLDRTQEKLGIVTCVWSYPTGILSIVTGDEVTETPKEEARGWTLAFLDPLRSDAERHVRYEVLAAVGDEAVAIVETEDKAKGFARDGAILVVRRGKQQVSVLSSNIGRRDRAEALRVLTELGKAIAKRLG